MRAKNKAVKQKAPAATGALEGIGEVLTITELLPEMLQTYPMTKYFTRAERKRILRRFQQRHVQTTN